MLILCCYWSSQMITLESSPTIHLFGVGMNQEASEFVSDLQLLDNRVGKSFAKVEEWKLMNRRAAKSVHEELPTNSSTEEIFEEEPTRESRVRITSKSKNNTNQSATALPLVLPASEQKDTIPSLVKEDMYLPICSYYG